MPLNQILQVLTGARWTYDEKRDDFFTKAPETVSIDKVKEGSAHIIAQLDKYGIKYTTSVAMTDFGGASRISILVSKKTLKNKNGLSAIARQIILDRNKDNFAADSQSGFNSSDDRSSQGDSSGEADSWSGRGSSGGRKPLYIQDQKLTGFLVKEDLDLTAYYAEVMKAELYRRFPVGKYEWQFTDGKREAMLDVGGPNPQFIMVTKNEPERGNLLAFIVKEDIDFNVDTMGNIIIPVEQYNAKKIESLTKADAKKPETPAAAKPPAASASPPVQKEIPSTQITVKKPKALTDEERDAPLNKIMGKDNAVRWELDRLRIRKHNEQSLQVPRLVPSNIAGGQYEKLLSALKELEVDHDIINGQIFVKVNEHSVKMLQGQNWDPYPTRDAMVPLLNEYTGLNEYEGLSWKPENENNYCMLTGSKAKLRDVHGMLETAGIASEVSKNKSRWGRDGVYTLLVHADESALEKLKLAIEKNTTTPGALWVDRNEVNGARLTSPSPAQR